MPKVQLDRVLKIVWGSRFDSVQRKRLLFSEVRSFFNTRKSYSWKISVSYGIFTIPKLSLSAVLGSFNGSSWFKLLSWLHMHNVQKKIKIKEPLEIFKHNAYGETLFE